MLAAAVAVYASWGGGSRGLAALAGLAGVALVLVAVFAAWGGGLVAGPALLLAAYAMSLAGNGGALDWAAPFVAVGLLGVIEFGSWSLELRDGAEERPLVRVPSVFVVFGAALAASAVVLAVGGIRTDAGLALWALGAAAAIGLLALITHGGDGLAMRDDRRRPR